MSRIKDLKQKFKDNEISKSNFIDQMFDIHKTLFDYQGELKNTDIKNIEISDDCVIFTSREDNIKIAVNLPDKRIAPIEAFNFNQYEDEEAAMIYDLIEPDFTVFDVGANIGWYSLCISKKNPNVKLYTFEPLKPIYDNLKRNIELNNTSISSFNFGFSNEKKEIEFYYDPEYCSRTSQANLAEKDVKKEVCQLTTMDDFVKEKNIDKIDFIKCDVEGAEFFVYQGAIETIRRFKPIIFSEMLRKWAAKFDYHPNDIIDLLKNEGYSCYEIKGNKLKEIIEVTEKTIATNFVFLNKETHQEQIKIRLYNDNSINN